MGKVIGIDLGTTNSCVAVLDGEKSKHIVNYKVLETLASKTNLKIDFGGGLKSTQDVKIAFESGANKMSANGKRLRAAVSNPELGGLV